MAVTMYRLGGRAASDIGPCEMQSLLLTQRSSASTKTGCPYLEEGVLQGLQCCWPLGWVPLAAPGYKIECLRRGLRHLQAHAALSLYS